MKNKILAILLSSIFLIGCKSATTVSNSTVENTFHKEILVQKDSVYIDRYHYINKSNDTIYITDSVFKYSISHIRDTTVIVDTISFFRDSIIYKDNIVYKEVKNYKTKTFLIILILIIIFYGACKLYKKIF